MLDGAVVVVVEEELEEVFVVAVVISEVLVGAVEVVLAGEFAVMLV